MAVVENRLPPPNRRFILRVGVTRKVAAALALVVVVVVVEEALLPPTTLVGAVMVSRVATRDTRATTAGDSSRVATTTAVGIPLGISSRQRGGVEVEARPAIRNSRVEGGASSQTAGDKERRLGLAVIHLIGSSKDGHSSKARRSSRLRMAGIKADTPSSSNGLNMVSSRAGISSKVPRVATITTRQVDRPTLLPPPTTRTMGGIRAGRQAQEATRRTLKMPPPAVITKGIRRSVDEIFSMFQSGPARVLARSN